MTDLGFAQVNDRVVAQSDVAEAALEVADPTDTATYARLLALLAKCLTFTPEAERRVALAHQALGMAEESDDPTIVAGVAPSALAALWAPGNERLRNDVVAKALAAAEASGDPLLQFRVNVAARQVAIESGDPAMAAHTSTRLRAGGQAIGEPYLRWIVLRCETCRSGFRMRSPCTPGSSSCWPPSPVGTRSCSRWSSRR